MGTSTHPRVLVTGAGGFIGHHLVTALKQRGYRVRGVDITRPEHTEVDAGEFELRDLTLEPTYRWIEKQVTSRRPPWARAGC